MFQLYRYGETVSIVMWTENWQPDSYYDKIQQNLSRGLHTLCLLDIKTKEQTIDNMMKSAGEQIILAGEVRAVIDESYVAQLFEISV